MKYKRVKKKRTVEGYTRYSDDIIKGLLLSDTHPATMLCGTDARKCPCRGKAKYMEWCQEPQCVFSFNGRCRRVKIIRKTVEEVEVVKAKP